MQPVSTSSLDRDAALQFLLGRIDYERTSVVPYGNREFRLDRMRELLSRLGNPEAGLKIVHVAGTKGKGSTAAMTAAMLTAAGYRAGLYSSPHLERVEERLAIDGQPCTSDEFVRLLAHTRAVVEAMDHLGAADDNGVPRGPTYFEILTAMALVHFAERRVDAAVLEVGLGGRLDSTNVCQPLVSVITSISFDHMKQLGNTLAAIAGEKAGIIKPGVPVVSGVVPAEPRDVIVEVARQNQSRLVELGRDFDFDYCPPRSLETTAAGGRIDFRYRSSGVERHLRNIDLKLVGRHQGANAAVALATLFELEQLGWKLPEQALREGLARVQWPARMEILCRRPTVVLDGAHNLASIQAVADVLAESFTARKRYLIFATTREKDLRGMLEHLLPRCDGVIFTRYLNNPRGVPPEELAALATEMGSPPQRICGDPAAAWREIQGLATADDLVLITGSFFIAAEMRAVVAATPATFSALGSP